MRVYLECLSKLVRFELFQFTNILVPKNDLSCARRITNKYFFHLLTYATMSSKKTPHLPHKSVSVFGIQIYYTNLNRMPYLFFAPIGSLTKCVCFWLLDILLLEPRGQVGLQPPLRKKVQRSAQFCTRLPLKHTLKLSFSNITSSLQLESSVAPIFIAHPMALDSCPL